MHDEEDGRDEKGATDGKRFSDVQGVIEKQGNSEEDGVDDEEPYRQCKQQSFFDILRAVITIQGRNGGNGEGQEDGTNNVQRNIPVHEEVEDDDAGKQGDEAGKEAPGADAL